MSRSLGFSDTYALGMTPQRAERLGITKVSDLARHPLLRFGLSDEFLNRADGWPALQAAYGLSAADVRGLDHDIAYIGRRPEAGVLRPGGEDGPARIHGVIHGVNTWRGFRKSTSYRRTSVRKPVGRWRGSRPWRP